MYAVSETVFAVCGTVFTVIVEMCVVHMCIIWTVEIDECRDWLLVLTAWASWSCVMPTSSNALDLPSPRRKVPVLGWSSELTSRDPTAHCRHCSLRQLLLSAVCVTVVFVLCWLIIQVLQPNATYGVAYAMAQCSSVCQVHGLYGSEQAYLAIYFIC